MPNQAEIHKKCISKQSNGRWRAAKLLKRYFSILPDKAQAWQDLISLTKDEDINVRWCAVDALRTSIIHIPNEEQARQDLIRLAHEKDFGVRIGAIGILITSIIHIPNKEQAWQDLIRLAQDEDSDMRQRAADALGTIIIHIPNKEQAWQDLIRLAQYEDSNVRRCAVDALRTSIIHIPNKEQARQDLIRLAHEKDRGVRWRAADALRTSTSHIPNKKQAWQDLHRDRNLRLGAARALETAISHTPNDEQTWQDLHRLSQDVDSNVRWRAADALGTSIIHIPNKEQAWQDLIRLAHDKDHGVRWHAADALGTAIGHIPNKELARQDLHRLAHDRDRNLRLGAARALGTVISHTSNKEQARQDLDKLSQDEDSLVRTCAFHSLGRASVSNATETHDKATFKKELEVAIAFFEKSSQESEYSPARFCHPFYRSYLAITFQEAKEDEVQRYLADAKIAVGDSRSKELLLEAVENLAMAMEEIQKHSQNINAGGSWEEIQMDLKEVYEPYCNKAAELLDESYDLAPGATKCVRKAFPIINEHIKSTIAEIQAKSKALCRATSGSEIFRPLGSDFNRLAQGLSSKDLLKCRKMSIRMVPFLQGFCKVLPPEKRGHVYEIIAEIKTEDELPDILSRILEAITYLQPNIEMAAYESENTQRFKDIQKELGVVNNKLDEIQYAVFRQKICSGNIISNLIAIMTELEKLHQISLLRPNLSLKEIYSCQEEQLQELSKDIEDRFHELEDVLKGKASTSDVKTILDKFEQLKPEETWKSKVWNLADKGATLLTYISFLHEVITVLRPS